MVCLAARNTPPLANNQVPISRWPIIGHSGRPTNFTYPSLIKQLARPFRSSAAFTLDSFLIPTLVNPHKWPGNSSFSEPLHWPCWRCHDHHHHHHRRLQPFLMIGALRGSGIKLAAQANCPLTVLCSVTTSTISTSPHCLAQS